MSSGHMFHPNLVLARYLGHLRGPAADVQRPPGVTGQAGDLPGHQLDGVRVEDGEALQPAGHDGLQLGVGVRLEHLPSKM